MVGCTSDVRYHYPRLSEEVDRSLDRLERTIEIHEDERAAGEAHAAAKDAAHQARHTFKASKFRGPRAEAALDDAATKLEAAADLARAGMTPEAGGPQRDRLYDLSVQARRAGREVRALARVIGGLAEGEE